ncbi:hypothetical protein OS493_039130 [Desmophyllum pertusum]|uniref:Uncharacterized protein n=1 Tax=Desmophyllum pertusum TaxID=174260 RepID=A0A9W9YKL4_9CNID|nr:hypothetical protein OS493_039130 [Desmophyllum pertusum]
MTNASTNSFIKTAGTATHLLFNRRQVNDIKSFCTEFGKSSVFFGRRNLQTGTILSGGDNVPEPDSETQRPANHPVMIGPVALVKDKTETSNSHLFKALVSEEPSLSQSLKGSGSEGEIQSGKGLGLQLSTSVPI